MEKRCFCMFSSLYFVVCFLLGNSPASEFYIPRFGSSCLFHLHRQVGACRMNQAGDMFGYYMGKGLAWNWSEPLGRWGTEQGGTGQSTETSCEGSPAYIEADGRMCEGDRTSRGGQGMVEVKLLCFRWLYFMLVVWRLQWSFGNPDSHNPDWKSLGQLQPSISF